MKADPGQMNNLIDSNDQLLGRSIPQIINRLDALLLVLKSCKESSCQQPWFELHPGHAVNNLVDALQGRFDNFYDSQVKVSFDGCDGFYNIVQEGAQWATDGKVFGGQ